MSVITVFSGSFCKDEPVVRDLLSSTGYRLITDNDIVDEAARLSGIPANRIRRAFSSKQSVFNGFTHEKELSTLWLKLAVAEKLKEHQLLFYGFTGILIPKKISHVLRVCIIADMKFRISYASASQKISEKEAVNLIHEEDEERIAWISGLYKKNDPWDSSLYDLVIPMDKMDHENAVSLIAYNAGKDVVKTTERSGKAVDDFLISAKVEMQLAREGHNVDVSVKEGEVKILVNKYIAVPGRLEEDLRAVAGIVPGVRSVIIKMAEGCDKKDIYRKYDFKTPSKVLLVDDEREFVQTLSDRLIRRYMGSAVAYDGESALDLISEDEPEIMILDLKMPGINGIEVLRRVRQSNPDIQVIILTGHGTKADRELCMKLGAFAFLEKPVKLEILSETIKNANDIMKAKKSAK